MILENPKLKTSASLLVLASVVCIAFALNSTFNRLALEGGYIDAVSFSFIRIASAVMLLWVLYFSRQPLTSIAFQGSKWATAYLILYIYGFSFAYLSLNSALGALILFSTVQVTMIFYGLLQGTRLPVFAWGGVLLAIAGLFVLLLPGADAPNLLGAGLMVLAGLGWAGFSILGLKNSSPGLSMLQSFTLALPIALLVSFWFRSEMNLTAFGILLASLSGGITSALGYWAWYALLPKLTAISAAVLQLTVPIIVAVIGVLFLQETLSLNFYLATVLVVVGLLVYRFNLN